jgi:hypothetical protein
MASHPTKLFLGIVEPHIVIFLEAGEEMSEMTVVTLDGGVAGEVTLCANAEYPYGWCTQNVTTDGVTQYGVNGLITRTAKVGDKIGIYANGGILKTDKLAVGGIAFGDLIYAGASGGSEGYVTNVAGAAPVPVGLVDQAPDSDNIIRFKSLI